MTQVSKETDIVKEVKDSKDLKVVEKTTYTTTEYYPPAAETPSNDPSDKPGTPEPEKKKGAIKSETTWTTEAKTEDKGETEIKENNESKEVSKGKEDSVIKTAETIKPAADPYLLRYVFYILALGTVIVIYLKRTMLKSVLSWVGKFLKI